ncbi:putative MFS family arabinose efflux permease [Neorhizobium galegae]|uniref:MFS transporter n=1 Tax=Neorhizobium galegae TaxID=399 RepID=UPI001EB849BF|nr:MFS transporter [Neorhizobium galegae]MBP2559097.1 putative MFS family arabinose efflux permease [Neorhizobium galegae]
MTDSTFEEDDAVRDTPSPNTSAKARWDAVIALTLGVFGLVTAEFLPASLLTPISADLGISPGVAGQTVTVTAVVAAFAGPGVVIGTRSFNRRWTLFGLTALLILSCALAALANGLTVLLVSRVLLGVGLGGFWAMAGALAMRLVPMNHLPRAMAMIFTGVSVATVMAAPLGAYIGSTLGWRAAFVLAGAVGVLALLAQAVTVPSLPPAGHAGLGTLAEVLKRPKIRIGLIATLLIVAGHFAGFTYIRPYLEDVPHLNVEMVSLLLLAYGVGGFFGNIVGGIITERSSALGVVFASGLIAVSAVILVSLGASTTAAAVAITLWGFAFGALPVSIQSYITRAAPDEAESAGALLLTTFQIAISSGAVLGGLLIDVQGPLGVMTFLGIASVLGASVMVMRGGRQVQLSQG